MDKGQRAIVALTLEPMYANATKEAERNRKMTPRVSTPADLRESSSPHERESTGRAAKAVGASGRGVQQAKTIARDAPDLLDQVPHRASDYAASGSGSPRRTTFSRPRGLVR